MSDDKILTREIAEEILANADLDPQGELDLSDYTITDDAVADILTMFPGDLWLRFAGTVGISDAAAESLSRHTGGGLFLSGMTSLSDAAAKCLACHRGNTLSVDLNTLPDATIHSLSKYKGELWLNDLTSLSDEAARSLCRHKGELRLCGLTSLSDVAAERLGRHPGTLDLRGLTSLSPIAAHCLIKHGDLLINECLDLSEIASKSRVTNKGSCSSMSSPKHDITCDESTLTSSLAEQYLTNDNSLDLAEFTSIHDVAAEILAEVEGILNLSGLASLTDEAAHGLSRCAGGLNLRGVTTLSDKSAESLSGHEGELNLSGLLDLSDAAAESLSKHVGTIDVTLANWPASAATTFQRSRAEFLSLQTCCNFARDPGNSLRSLRTLTVAQAEILVGTHWYLNLAGIKSVDDHVADILSMHVGSLSLLNVISLSPTAAALLAKHQGPLFMTLDDLPEVVQSILSTHPSMSKTVDCGPDEEDVGIEWFNDGDGASDADEEEYDEDELYDDDDWEDDESFNLKFSDFLNLFTPEHLPGIKGDAIRLYRERMTEDDDVMQSQVARYSLAIKAARSIGDVSRFLSSLVKHGIARKKKRCDKEVYKAVFDDGYDHSPENTLIQCISRVVLPFQPESVIFFTGYHGFQWAGPKNEPLLAFDSREFFERRLTDAGEAMARTLGKSEL